MKLIFKLLLLISFFLSCASITSEARSPQNLVLEKNGSATVVLSMDQQRKIPESKITLRLRDVQNPNIMYIIPFYKDHIEYSIFLNPGTYEIKELTYSDYEFVGISFIDQMITLKLKKPVQFTVEKDELKNIGTFIIEYHGTDSPWVIFKAFE